MNTFYLVRHGETENNVARRLSGWVDSPLTPTGLLPIEKVIAKLQGIPIDAMYSSDLGRAFITAYVVARCLGFTDEIIRLPGLREVGYGDAGNMKTEQAYKLYPRLDRDTHYIPPNGESLDHMQKRVLAAIDEINKKHTNATILIIAHSGVMAALNASLLGVDFGQHNISEAYPHDYVAKFAFEGGKVQSFEAVK